ncbi:hypothetical protein SCA6_017157 [Theobroma cacao]
MSIIETPLISSNLLDKFDHFVPFDNRNPSILYQNPPKISIVMWRNIAKHAISRRTHSFQCYARTYSFLGSSQDSIFHEKSKFWGLKFGSFCSNSRFLDMGGRRIGEVVTNVEYLGKRSFGFPRNEIGCSGLCPRGYVSVAEAVSSTDVAEDVSVVEEIKELLDEMKKEQRRETGNRRRRRQMIERGMGESKYRLLRRRQVKIVTEAWEQAAKEYRELLMDICEHKLAPNLPYIKSLFLGWFEPSRDAIIKEQELYRLGKLRAGYAGYLDQLPAEMTAVITIHKLMGLLMTGGEHGCARVVQAACLIGDAIEQESNAEIKEQEKLRKKVTDLIKKQKLPAGWQIVKGQDDTKPWGQDAKAKVGSHLFELLMQTAYIQPPADQLAHCPRCSACICAFFKNCSKRKQVRNGFLITGRRYVVIECDPLVRKGLERTARHMVIPYMPMLVPPVRWTGYDRGAYLFLPSYIMCTHGVKQQREAVKRTPRKQLEPALDTLGCTKWRVNKWVLNVVDRIWTSGGHLADLVDSKDVRLPEKPDSEDEALLRKWKWKVRSVKKENRVRHSLRCDVELKLAVAQKMKDEEGFYYPHNLDFRGRAYPMHPYLNHLGSDLCRGILEFAEGRPLGESGLRWLKIHLANRYAGGVDKLSHEGRLAFAENHLDDIFDFADRPLEGKRWWLKAEDPFQCLAVCINLAEALRSSSPETFVSHIPVYQKIEMEFIFIARDLQCEIYQRRGECVEGGKRERTEILKSREV